MRLLRGPMSPDEVLALCIMPQGGRFGEGVFLSWGLEQAAARALALAMVARGYAEIARDGSYLILQVTLAGSRRAFLERASARQHHHFSQEQVS